MRHDLYGPIHKGLRHFMHATLVRLGQADVEDPSDLASALDQLRAMLSMRASHLELEEQIIRPALDARVPGWMLGALTHEHDEHRIAIASLSRDARTLARAEDRANLRGRKRHLYLALARRIAEDLEHMEVEETVVNRLLWDHFDDDELLTIQRALVECESPDQIATRVRWVMPALSHEERIGLVASARGALGPASFANLLGLARAMLTPRDYEKLVDALGLHTASSAS